MFALIIKWIGFFKASLLTKLLIRYSKIYSEYFTPRIKYFILDNSLENVEYPVKIQIVPKIEKGVLKCHCRCAVALIQIKGKFNLNDVKVSWKKDKPISKIIENSVHVHTAISSEAFVSFFYIEEWRFFFRLSSIAKLWFCLKITVFRSLNE